MAKAIDDALAKVADATAEAVETLRRKKLPVFPVVKSMMPNIFVFDVSCLATHPNWFVLTYNGPSNALTATNRAWVRTTWPFLRASAPAGYQLDEYPFASTDKGGPAGPAMGCMVPALENSTQGGLLRAFYGLVLRWKRDPFLVVPVPV